MWLAYGELRDDDVSKEKKKEKEKRAIRRYLVFGFVDRVARSPEFMNRAARAAQEVESGVALSIVPRPAQTYVP